MLIRKIVNAIFPRRVSSVSSVRRKIRNKREATTTISRLSIAAIVLVALIAGGPLMMRLVRADNLAQSLPFSQNWTNTGLITIDDDWSGVPGIIGYRGDGLTGATGVNPQTVVAESIVVDVNANQTNPNTFATGGVSEFHIANPVVALQGSGTARAPYLQLNLNTTGNSNINVVYNLRDIDGSTDNAIQPVALQFRVGSTGNFTNVPAGFVADATTGPSLATLVTPVNVTLPAAADNRPLVQVRIITTDAVGNDEWVGIDDISVTGSGGVLPTNPSGTGQATPNSVVAGNSTLLTVNVTPGANPASTGLAVTADLTTIDGSSTQTFFDDGTNGDAVIGDNIFSFFATTFLTTTPGSKTLPFSITDAEARGGSGSIALTVQAPPPPSDHVVISQIYGGGGNTGATYQNDYVELYNPSPTTFNLNGWSIQYAAATGSGWSSGLVPLAGSIAPGEYYLAKLGSNGAVGAVLPLANVESITNMSATTGKVALVNDSVGLTGATATCPTDDPNIVDFVGYGTTANCREGSANAPAPSVSSAIFRNGGGAVDTNQNGSDFLTGSPNPRRTAAILDAPPSVSSTDTDSDPFASTPAPRDASVAVFFSEPVEVTGTWYDLTCAITGPHTTVVAAGPRNWVITPDVDFQPGEQCTFRIFAANVKDSDTDDSEPNTDFMQADYSTNFTVATGAVVPYDPSVHLTMGNPNGAITDINQPDNYLLEKPEYAISYNRGRGGPNWVSWHLSNDWTGSLTRVDTFRPDPRLPVEWNRVNQFDYTGSGFDRGHMTPSADRLATLPINQATFLMDNIIPQAPDNNQITWNNMEQALRTLTPANELYIVAGGAGTGGSGNNGPATTIAGGRITVPAYTWKVALVIPKGENDISRVNCSSRSIAVIVPNTNGTNSDWTTYLTTVDSVETLTGYDFFSNLPEPIQRCVEAGINGTNPPLDTDADGVPDSTDNCPFVANSDQADFDGDTIGDSCDEDDDNDGFSDATENAAGSNPLNPASTPETCDGIDNDLDGLTDEGFADTDGDGQADCVDLDDDNDGQLDVDEIACGSNPLNAASKSADTDGDNHPDCVDPDDDNDGVLDGADNCQFTANTTQTDTDGDGIGDACDPDDDNDGVPDGSDLCPGTPANIRVNSAGCPDADGDGIADTNDNCPMIANSDQRDTDGDGTGDLCTAYQNPTGGQFVIGNLVNMAGGATVNIWGSQWSQNNPMSVGSAPSAFKGFEDGSAIPTCGDNTWTSQPGNSSNPPATVPEFMRVIVSSSITTNGSVITGNVSRVVIIKTNPGYGPSPGQQGTGKVIAILCGQ